MLDKKGREMPPPFKDINDNSPMSFEEYRKCQSWPSIKPDELKRELKRIKAKHPKIRKIVLSTNRYIKFMESIGFVEPSPNQTFFDIGGIIFMCNPIIDDSCVEGYLLDNHNEVVGVIDMEAENEQPSET